MSLEGSNRRPHNRLSVLSVALGLVTATEPQHLNNTWHNAVGKEYVRQSLTLMFLNNND